MLNQNDEWVKSLCGFLIIEKKANPSRLQFRWDLSYVFLEVEMDDLGRISYFAKNHLTGDSVYVEPAKELTNALVGWLRLCTI